MTRRLEEMMTRKKTTKKKKVTRKRGPKKLDPTVHRGIRVRVGLKAAMVGLYDSIKDQGRTPPAVDLSADDPAAKFAVQMYTEIGQWSEDALLEYIEFINGERPKVRDLASMLGTVKSIFHALFMDEDDTSKAEVLRYDSKWKMWPDVRASEGRKRRRKSEMATKKATAKKSTAKKKAASKKAPAKRAAGKKKAASKKAAANGRANGIEVHSAKVEKLLKRKTGASVMEIVDSVGVSKKSARKLIAELGGEAMEERGRYSV